MDFEKAYKEALERAKGYLKEYYFEEAVKDIFPELKEKSEDEKVRKALIEMVHDRMWFDYNVHKEEVLAWLEKQGEVESDNDDIEVEEKGIREAFNKIEDEKQCKQKSQRMISAEAKEAMYGKPAWTKEDDVRLQACIDTLQAESLMGKVDTVMTNWLKALKQRIEGKL